MKKTSISQSLYGLTPEGKQVQLYTLKNNGGMEVNIITFGGIITALKVPNKHGVVKNVVLGYDTLEPYLTNPTFLGAIIGRYCNRIAKGEFSLNKTVYKLPINNGTNCLHGGNKGFDKVLWNAKTIEDIDRVGLELSYFSPDLEAGFPGNLKVTVVYTLTVNNTLEVSYKATTDKTTVVNLTQHSYFNLSGDFSKTILDQLVMIDADAYIPINSDAIPQGNIDTVRNTPFDFRTPKKVGKDINANHDQIEKGGGFDHCWVLNHQNKHIRLAASVHDETSGRYMEVFTDEPGVQFYTANFLDTPYKPRVALCLETQHYPDSPNQDAFPSTVLNPEETYTSHTAFKFSIK
ncbi:galactose mutarotase [Formosa sediminum]|uniref:Aldose 1-epimerase n=1 Tax=Formosa sediminum TaxID=2594004 RepID=A0A516GVK0_9FLAO|nr:aldose epimerase family protein [Formosa sediminum]QDO95558.1 galactose mutarotase [Formosa sediminum]